MKLLLVTTAILTVAASNLSGQPVEAKAFEVLSVKENLSNGPDTDYLPHVSGKRVTMHNADLSSILAFAYDLPNPNYQLAAGPWEKSLRESFDIDALTPGSVITSDLREMFRALLGERFKLSGHWEKRNLLAYDLVVARGVSRTDAAPSRPVKNSVGFGGSSCWVEIADQGQVLVGRGASMVELAVVLTRKMSAPVRDRTGIAGSFDYRILFSSGVDSSEAPVLPTAIRELGLAMQKTRGEFDVFVIDHIGAPALISGKAFHIINYEHLHGLATGIEFQSQLFLHGSKDRGATHGLDLHAALFLKGRDAGGAATA